MFLKLTLQQTGRWTTIASYHYQKWKDYESRIRALPDGSEKDTCVHNALWHRDACEFMRHIESQALSAGVGDATAVCPICDGKGVI